MPATYLSRAMRLASVVALGATIAASPLSAGKSGHSSIQIEKMGAFTAGGKVEGNANRSLHCDHGYVEYQIPARARKVSLFMWHSSSAQVWQNRWDGGEGYQSIFLRRGFPVYLWDGPRVGRANWGCEEYTYTPAHGRDQGNFIAWRFGAKPGAWFPGIQFPTADQAAYDQAMSARYQEFDVAQNAHLQADAAAKAIDRIGPVVALTNSAGGWRAMLAALKTDNIKGIVAYETAAFVFPEGRGPKGPEGGFGPTHVPMEEFKRLTKIPIQLVWGDNIGKGPGNWPDLVEQSREFVRIINANGGKAEVLILSSAGLKGNTHIPFADMNNVAVADELSAFLKKHGLDLR